MELAGGCQCGAVRYIVKGEPQHTAFCHCEGCRKSAGAPMMGWAAFAEADFAVTQGVPVTYNSSGAAMRSFCGRCGTGLFYRNAQFLPGIVDIQSATVEEPERLPLVRISRWRNGWTGWRRRTSFRRSSAIRGRDQVLAGSTLSRLVAVCGLVSVMGASSRRKTGAASQINSPEPVQITALSSQNGAGVRLS